MRNPFHLFQIKHKLFAIFVLSNVLVIVSMWQVFQWSFDKGFVSYTDERDSEFIKQMSTRSGNLYFYYKNWDFLVNEIRQEIDWKKAKLQNMRDLIPPPSTPNLDLIYPSQYFRTRFLLFDENRKPIIGKGSFKKVKTEPVTVNNEIVGYVGLRSVRELVQDHTLRFVKQQGEALLLISAFMLIIAALLTWPLAQWLSIPICSMRRATKKLAAGEFEARLKIKGHDEVADLGRDFNNLAKTLEKTRQARKRWVADTAHELRTPVAILRGEIEAMQDGIIKVTPESLESLLQETMHIGRMIDDLNQLSMHDMGSLNYHMEPTNIDEVLRDTVQSMTRTFHDENIELILKIDKKAKYERMADRDRLFQLFSNLMNNSLKYTDSPGSLHITLSNTLDVIEIHFEDSSPGVSDEDKDRIFEQFYRVENSRNRATGGRGLGLAICNQIIEGHNGSMSAYHSPQGGLGIKINLPLNQQD